jgi:hypothetical protein
VRTAILLAAIATLFWALRSPGPALPVAEPGASSTQKNQTGQQQVVARQAGPLPPEEKGLEREEFRALLDRTQRELPTKQSLQGLSDEEVHQMPAPLREAAGLLGLVAQAVHDNPDLAADAYTFYEECSTAPFYLDPVAALCLVNHLELADRLGFSVNTVKAAPQVQELAARLRTPQGTY